MPGHAPSRRPKSKPTPATPRVAARIREGLARWRHVSGGSCGCGPSLSPPTVLACRTHTRELHAQVVGRGERLTLVFQAAIAWQLTDNGACDSQAHQCAFNLLLNG